MKPKNSICKLSRIRIKKEPRIWLFFGVCIYIVIAHYYESIRIPTLFFREFTDAINEVAFTLSCSYIAGMILYVLTEFLNTTKKARAVLPNAVESLRYLKDDFYELSQCIYEKDWLCDKDAEEEVFKEIAGSNYESESVDGSIKISESLVRLFKMYVSKFDSCLRVAMLYEPYFSPDEYQKLTDIYMSYAFAQVRNHFGTENGTNYPPEKLKTFIEKLIEVNRKTVELYDVLSKQYGYVD